MNTINNFYIQQYMTDKSIKSLRRHQNQRRSSPLQKRAKKISKEDFKQIRPEKHSKEWTRFQKIFYARTLLKLEMNHVDADLNFCQYVGLFLNKIPQDVNSFHLRMLLEHGSIKNIIIEILKNNTKRIKRIDHSFHEQAEFNQICEASTQNQLAKYQYYSQNLMTYELSHQEYQFLQYLLLGDRSPDCSESYCIDVDDAQVYDLEMDEIDEEAGSLSDEQKTAFESKSGFQLGSNMISIIQF